MGQATRPISERVTAWIKNLAQHTDRVIIREGTDADPIAGSIRITESARDVSAEELTNLVQSIAAMAGRSVTLRLVAVAGEEKTAAITMRVDLPGEDELAGLVPNVTKLRTANIDGDTVELRMSEMLMAHVNAIMALLLTQQREQMSQFNELHRITTRRIRELENDAQNATRIAKLATESVTEATDLTKQLSEQVDKTDRRERFGDMLEKVAGEKVGKILEKVGEAVMSDKPNGAS